MDNQQDSSSSEDLISENEAKIVPTIKDRKSFHIPCNERHQLDNRPEGIPSWSYEWYRHDDGGKIKVSYASNLKESEELARKFLHNKILGFDMEWVVEKGEGKWDFRQRLIQEKISLIQVASETEIVLFHTGLHKGNCTADLIAPSLRKIIESRSIIKTGLAIISADAFRLKHAFGLEPQGFVCLNDVHKSLKYCCLAFQGRRWVSLADLTKEHLKFPLKKGDVRTGQWQKPLDAEQRHYAASDAYVGLLLYHVFDV